MKYLSEIESILFVASKPLTMTKIAKALGVTGDQLVDAFETLEAKFSGDAGIHVLRDGDTLQLVSNPHNADAVEQFVKDEVSAELTKAQLETLTIVAYRSPVTRPELEHIRGVNCSMILRNLLMRGLIVEEDDENEIMPVYRVSFDALAALGISSVEELPDYTQLREHTHIEQSLAQSDE